MTRPRLLDLYAGAGGAAMGYHRAGFEVVGVDIVDQPNYPFEFRRMDALKLTRTQVMIAAFDAVHASPPCQAFSLAQRIQDREHPELIEDTRDLLQFIGLPYVIENVEGAPLLDPAMLCGAMFPELAVYRHRLFETSFPFVVPDHPLHTAPLRKMGRPPRPGEFMHVVGNFSGAAQARRAMGIDWMVRDELREAIPPAYTEHVGRQLLEQLTTPKRPAGPPVDQEAPQPRRDSHDESVDQCRAAR